MAGFKTDPAPRTKSWAYENFMGLDSSRDITSLETGNNQHLSTLLNATCDWRGQIVRDPGVKFEAGSNLPVSHVRFFSPGETVFTEQDGAGQSLTSSRGHSLASVYPLNSIVTSTVFARRVYFACRGVKIRSYDGSGYSEIASPAMSIARPSYITSIARRLAVAGIAGQETEVHFSRVDNADIFPDDEPDDSESVLRAGIIDVGNLIGTADRITAIASFEQNRLVIFTEDRALIYRIDPDIDQWQIDEAANIRVGCVSHNTVASAGTDLLFCSRSGVHSVKRSEQNGILVSSYTLSDKVDLLYRELINSVEDPKSISAVFDQDRAQYHIFFPQPGGTLSRCLTLTMNPELGEDSMPKFSTSSFLNARCADFLGGELSFGTSAGVYTCLTDESTDEDGIYPEAYIVTPFLWHGSLTDEKQTHSIIFQASGTGIIEMDAQDDKGRILGSMRFEINDNPDDNSFEDVPLSAQYERLWQHRYRAAQYRFRIIESLGLIRINGFAVKVRVGS